MDISGQNKTSEDTGLQSLDQRPAHHHDEPPTGACRSDLTLGWSRPRPRDGRSYVRACPEGAGFTFCAARRQIDGGGPAPLPFEAEETNLRRAGIYASCTNAETGGGAVDCAAAGAGFRLRSLRRASPALVRSRRICEVGLSGDYGLIPSHLLGSARARALYLFRGADAQEALALVS